MDPPIMNINEQLEQGLISFDQWLESKNLEERHMLEAMLQKGALTENQFHEAMAAQRQPSSSYPTQQLNDEQTEESHQLKRGSISFYLQDYANSMTSGSDISDHDNRHHTNHQQHHHQQQQAHNEFESNYLGTNSVRKDSFIKQALSPDHNADYIAKQIAERALDQTRVLEDKMVRMEEKIDENERNFATTLERLVEEFIGRLQSVESVEGNFVLQNEDLSQRVLVLERAIEIGYVTNQPKNKHRIPSMINMDTFLDQSGGGGSFGADEDEADEKLKWRRMKTENVLKAQNNIGKSDPKSIYQNRRNHSNSNHQIDFDKLDENNSDLSDLDANVVEDDEEDEREEEENDAEPHDTSSQSVTTTNMPFAGGGWFSDKEMKNLLRHGSVSDMHVKTHLSNLEEEEGEKVVQTDATSISLLPLSMDQTSPMTSATSRKASQTSEEGLDVVQETGDDGDEEDDDEEEDDDDDKWHRISLAEEAVTNAVVENVMPSIEEPGVEDNEEKDAKQIPGQISGKVLGGHRMSAYLKFATKASEKFSDSESESDSEAHSIDKTNDAETNKKAIIQTNLESDVIGGHLVTDYLKYATSMKKNEVDDDDDDDSSQENVIDALEDEIFIHTEASTDMDDLTCLDFDLKDTILAVGFTSTLNHLATRMAVNYGFISSASQLCSQDTFIKFVDAVAEGYALNPYHNSLHAADVMVTANAYLQNSGAVQDAMSWSQSRYGLMIASMVHDLGHPARMNPFMVQTKQPLTLAYSGESGVLEAMHADRFTQLLSRIDVFEAMESSDKALMREQVVELVLATDLSRQGEILGLWKGKRGTQTSNKVKGWDLDVRDNLVDRSLFLKMVIKAADVSNPAKSLSVYLSWTGRILEEFYSQGDEERSLGIPVTSMPQCDRQKPSMSGGQKGFISFVVKPTFDALVNFSSAVLSTQGSDSEGLKPTLTNIVSNITFWKQVDGKVSAQDMSAKCLPSDLDLSSLMPSANAEHFLAFNKALLSPVVCVNDELVALDFDMKDTVEAVGFTSTLNHLATRMAVNYGFISSASQLCSQDSFIKFVDAVAEGYALNPYHNSLHAADVMVTANAYLQNSGAVQDAMSWSQSRYALMIASMVHDLGHPARMNPFMVQTKQPLTLAYSGESGVLEAMHADRFTQLLSRIDVFEAMESSDKALMREQVVELVLATDLSRQGEIMEAWNSKRGTQTSNKVKGWDLDVRDNLVDRSLFLKMVIKAADVSNPAKSLSVYLSWTGRILEEFYSQGDEERSLGIPVTSMPQCDRQKPSMSGGQKGFISFVVKPTFDALVDFSSAVLSTQGSNSDGLKSTLTNIAANIAFWKQVDGKVSAKDMSTKNFPSDLDLSSLMPSSTAEHFLAFNKALLPPAISVDNDLISSVFDIKDTVEAVGFTSTLNHLATRMAVNYGFISSASQLCSQDTFIKFVDAVAEGYALNPYHNSLHAADVMVTANAYLQNSGAVQDAMSWSQSRYALMIASMVHDLGHPARMNPFMVQTKQPLTLAYSGESGVLEAMHADRFTQLLSRIDVFEAMESSDKALMREQVVELVLATDLSRQGEILGLWKGKCIDVGGDATTKVKGWALDVRDNLVDRSLFLKMVIKAADVSNPAKSLSVYLSWTGRILEEFYSQGDEERSLGIPVTSMPQCDRQKPSMSGGQKGFISFVVKPTFDALVNFSSAVLSTQGSNSDGLKSTLTNIAANIAFWKQVDGKVLAKDMSTKCLPSDLDLSSLMPSATAEHFLAFNKALLPPAISVDNDLISLVFDIKDTIEAVGFTSTLNHLATRMAVNYGFTSSASQLCSQDTFIKFVDAVAEGYALNPYHNSLHAADVMVTANAYLQNSGAVQGSWSWSQSRYALMIASMVHDLGHPARMNPFMVQTKQPLTLAYSGESGVLEAMHADRFTQLLSRIDVFEAMESNDKALMREQVVELVLATDLSRQGEIMEAWNSKRGTQTSNKVKGWDLDVRDNLVDRSLFLKMVIKAADVSNPAKSLSVYLSWTGRILEEFYSQGDEERSLGIPVTSMPQCDRQKPSMSGGQKGFISFVVKPTFDALVDFSSAVLSTQGSNSDGLKSTLTNIAANISFWKQVDGKVSAKDMSTKCLPSDLDLSSLMPSATAEHFLAFNKALLPSGGSTSPTAASSVPHIVTDRTVGRKKSPHGNSLMRQSMVDQSAYILNAKRELHLRSSSISSLSSATSDSSLLDRTHNIKSAPSSSLLLVASSPMNMNDLDSRMQAFDDFDDRESHTPKEENHINDDADGDDDDDDNDAVERVDSFNGLEQIRRMSAACEEEVSEEMRNSNEIRTSSFLVSNNPLSEAHDIPSPATLSTSSSAPLPPPPINSLKSGSSAPQPSNKTVGTNLVMNLRRNSTASNERLSALVLGQKRRASVSSRPIDVPFLQFESSSPATIESESLKHQMSAEAPCGEDNARVNRDAHSSSNPEISSIPQPIQSPNNDIGEERANNASSEDGGVLKSAPLTTTQPLSKKPPPPLPPPPSRVNPPLQISSASVSSSQPSIVPLSDGAQVSTVTHNPSHSSPTSTKGRPSIAMLFSTLNDAGDRNPADDINLKP